MALPYLLVVREASVARSAAHMVLPFCLMVREASVTLALYSSLP